MKTLAISSLAYAHLTAGRKFNIWYDFEKPEINVGGWSVDRTVKDRYEMLLDKIDAFLEKNEELTINFKFELFNPVTLAYIFKVIRKLNRACKYGKDVKMVWKCNSSYPDEMLHAGLELWPFCDFDFDVTYD